MSLCTPILRRRVQTTIALILVLDLDVLREILFNLAIHFVEVLVRQSIRRFVLLGLNWVSLKHGLESLDAINYFLFSVPLQAHLGVVKK